MINAWEDFLEKETKKEYYQKLLNFIKKEYQEKEIYPPYKDITKALKNTPLQKVKVVILGQDPYHGTGEAEGLCFSVKKGKRKPPSLKNIFKELKDDLGIEESEHGSLEKWTEEGIFLLNSVLTVIKDKPASHRNIGWETFTDNIIKELNNQDRPIVFILWGNYARSKKELITNKKHLIIESPHPSPFSARYGFFGSKPFSKTNNFLEQNNIKKIDWRI